MLELATDGLYITDGAGRLLAANAVFARMHGILPSALSETTLSDVNGEWDAPEVKREIEKNLSLPPGGTRLFETLHKKTDGSLFPVEISVRRIDASEGPRLVHFVRDISRRREAIDKLERLSRYEAIRSEITLRAFTAHSTREFLNALCRICTDEAEEILLATICRPNETGLFEFVASAGRTGFLEGSRILLDPSQPQGQGPTGTCFREGRAAFNTPLADVTWEAPWKDRAERYGLRSLSTLPILIEGKVWGVLALGHGEPRPVDPPLARLLEEIARTIARGIERIDVLRKERAHAALVEALIDWTDAGILLLQDGRIRKSNGTIARMLGYSGTDQLDGRALEEIFERLPHLWEGGAGEAAGELFDIPLRTAEGEGLFCDLSRHLLTLPEETDPLLVVTLRDSRLRHQKIRHLQRLSNFNSLLAKAGEAMAESEDEGILFGEICRMAVEEGRLPLAWIGRPGEDGIFRYLARFGRTDYLEGLRLSVDPSTPSGKASSAVTFREGRTIVQPSFTGPLAPWREVAARFCLSSNMTLPIFRRGKVYAVLTVYHEEEDAFDPELCGILEELAKNLSRGLDRIDLAEDRRRISAQNEAIFSSPAIGILLTAEGRIRTANARMQELLGETGIAGRPLADLFEEESAGRIMEAEKRIQEGKKSPALECARTSGGSLRWIELSGVPFSGEERTILWTAADITSRRQAQEEQRLFANALRSLEEGVAISDPDGRILYTNSTFEQLTGYGATDLAGKNCRILQGPETDRKTVREIRQALEKGTRFRGQILNYKKDGTPFWNLLSISPLRDKGGRITHFVGVQNDVTDIRELRDQNDRLAYLSHHDPLTGLANRTALGEHLEALLSRERRTGIPFAVGMIDLDDFKPVNDTWGHQAGDQLLRELARRLSGSLRHHDLAARLGGDEFVIVVEDLPEGGTSPAFAALLQRIHQALTSPFTVGDEATIRVGLSMGVAFYPEDGSTPDDLIRAADTVLGRLKEHKTDRERWWGTAREILTKEGAEISREEAEFGGEARRLLQKQAPLIKDSIKSFVDEFYRSLPQNPEAGKVLSRLSPREVHHLAEKQQQYLEQVLSPETSREALVEMSRHIGQIHFLTGVSSELLIEATSLYRRLLSSHLKRSLIYDRERRILLDTADRRIEIHVSTEVHAQAEMRTSYLEAALAASSSEDIPGETLDRIVALSGMAGACFLKDRAPGSLGLWEVRGRIPGASDLRTDPPSPLVEALLGAEAGGISFVSSLAAFLSSADGTFSDSPLRSALSLAIDTRPGRRLFFVLFGNFFHQFDSEAMRQFALALRTRLTLSREALLRPFDKTP